MNSKATCNRMGKTKQSLRVQGRHSIVCKSVGMKAKQVATTDMGRDDYKIGSGT